MELTDYLQYHSGKLERAAALLAKRKGVDADDALQLLLITAADTLGGECPANAPSSALGARIAHACYRDVADMLRSRQRAFDEEIMRTPIKDEPSIEEEPSIVVQDLVNNILSITTLSPRQRACLEDILANEGLAAFNESTLDSWYRQLDEKPAGRPKQRVPHSFIFSAHGLTPKQGRTLVDKVARFLQANNFRSAA